MSSRALHRRENLATPSELCKLRASRRHGRLLTGGFGLRLPEQLGTLQPDFDDQTPIEYLATGGDPGLIAGFIRDLARW